MIIREFSVEFAAVSDTVPRRSVCCTVDLEGRHYMDVFMRQHMRMNSSEFQLPKEGSIYDYLHGDTSRSPCGNRQPCVRT